MKLSDIVIKVRDYIDEEEEGSWKDTRLKRLIQTSSNEVSAMVMALDDSHYTKDHATGLSIEADKELYDLPTDFLKIKSITDENKQPLFRKNVSKRSDILGTGDIRYYYFQDNKIGILDIPSSAKTFPYKYVRVPTEMDLTNNDAVPDCPEYLCHDLIAVKAAMLALGIDEDEDIWLNKEANYLVEKIQNTYQKRNVDYPDVAPSDPNLELD